MEEKPIFVAEGNHAKILLFKNKVRIERNQSLISAQKFKGDKEIFLKFISAIRLKKSGGGLFGGGLGYIRFTLIGGSETPKGFASLMMVGDTSHAMDNENAIFFDRKQEEDIVKIKEMIEKKIGEG